MVDDVTKHDIKMSKILKQSNVFRRKIYDIPEEVGMDVAQALDMLEIKIKHKFDRKSHHKFIKKEKFEPSNFKKIQAKVIQKLNFEFCQELSNEVNNTPEVSSVNLSQWLRNHSPSRHRNILFCEQVTTGHLQGSAQAVTLTLTPQVLTIKTCLEHEHIILDEIQLVQLDEFEQICTIFATNCKPLILENFPEGKLNKFLLTLNYMVNKTKLMYYFSWNFVLKRQKCPQIKCCFPVHLSIEHKPKVDEIKIEDMLEYKIETLGDDDGDALELLEMESKWTSAFWILK